MCCTRVGWWVLWAWPWFVTHLVSWGLRRLVPWVTSVVDDLSLANGIPTRLWRWVATVWGLKLGKQLGRRPWHLQLLETWVLVHMLVSCTAVVAGHDRSLGSSSHGVDDVVGGPVNTKTS